MTIKKYFSSTDLKLIALLLMVLDHIYLYFSYTGLIPIWFTYLGRLSLPLFLFCLAEGFHYTRDRRKYILRLFGFYLIMEISRQLLMSALPRPDGILIVNNIFGTMFLIASAIYYIDQLSAHRKNIIYVFLYSVLLLAMAPLTLFVEGGWFCVLLGIMLYYTRANRLGQAVDYIVLSLLVWAAQASHQWLMVFAAPIFMLYNGEKGKGYKYMFYIFYPVHVWILYALSVIFYEALA